MLFELRGTLVTGGDFGRIHSTIKFFIMHPNFNNGCLSGPCPPPEKNELSFIYPSLVYTILGFLAICLASYAFAQ